MAAVTGSVDPQFRAFWVTGFGPAFWTPEQADLLISQARTGNVNVLVVQVGRRGDAFYNDSFQPRSEEPNFQPGFDALQYLIDRAHKEEPRLEIHAWVNTLVMANANALPKDPNHVFNLHGPQSGPDHWFTRRFDGLETSGNSYFLDPAHPEAAQYVVRVYAWLVSNYDVDGIHLDFIRYPETNAAGADWGYNPTAIARFNQELFGRSGIPQPSDPDWIRWRRDQVTQLVRKIYLTVTAINPRVKVSAATIAWGAGPKSAAEYYTSSAAYTRVLQDWLGWTTEGILDLNFPMNYDRETTASQALWFRDWVEFETGNQGSRRTIIGQGSFLNSIADSIRQIRSALAKAAGICGFSYQTPSSNGRSFSEMARALSQPSEYDSEPSPVFATVAPLPALPWKESPTKGHLMGWISPAATVSVNITGLENRSLKSDGRGWFGSLDLLPGIYTVTAGGEQQRVEVSPGKVSVLNFPASLVFPVVVSSATRFTGLALSNWSDSEIVANASYSGSQRTLRLAPRTQLAKLSSEIFESGAPQGWIEIEKKEGLSGFFQIGDSNLSLLDGGTEPLRASTRQVFDRLEGELYVLNPGPEAIDVKSTHYDAAGKVVSFDGLWLAPKERKRLTTSNPDGYLDLRGGGEITAFRWHETGSAATGIPALRPSAGGRLYSPHFAHGQLGESRTFSRVTLINTGETTATVTYRMSDDNGKTLASSMLTLAPHQRVELDGSQILGLSDPESRVPLVVGSLTFEGAANVGGTITFGDAISGRFQAGMPLSDRPAQRYIFNHVANTGTLFTGLGIMNASSNRAEILLEVFDREGRRTGMAQINLEPGRRTSRLIRELVPETAHQAGGYVVLTSQEQFVCFMLFATEALDFLSALPGT